MYLGEEMYSLIEKFLQIKIYNLSSQLLLKASGLEVLNILGGIDQLIQNKINLSDILFAFYKSVCYMFI